jgi:poly-gamma-glutamate synthesis protein (capsule biosynthesis protein)
VNHDIIDAKKHVDFLFVLPHDGIEYINIPLPKTIARYRDFIDFGADAVIGTHPHCPQGWETYKGKPIFYSLGNFLFNSKDGYDYRATNRPHWYEGRCVMLTIDNGTLSWEVVNTLNVDNLVIEIDHRKESLQHNEKICRYLFDKDAYDNYLKRICVTLGQKELSIVDRVFHPQTLKECTKLLFKNWKYKLRGKEITNDYSLLRLLTHDARRDLLMQTLERNNNK